MARDDAHLEPEQHALREESASFLHSDAVLALNGSADGSGPAPAEHRAESAAGDLPLVLLVEDEVLISLDLCDTLVKAGYEVLGPAHTLAGAMFLLNQQTPKLAIVDVLLRDGPCTEIAHQLREHGVPFLIHSGYGRHSAEMAGFADAPWLEKPALPSDVVKVLGKMSGLERDEIGVNRKGIPEPRLI